MARISRDKQRLKNFEALPERAKEVFLRALESVSANWKLFFEVFDFSDFICDSPIETIFCMCFEMVSFHTEAGMCSNKQVEITTENGKKYRVDFIIQDFNTANSVIVECDGHDFHEKTKQQVARNNDRDLDLKMSGYDVIHFSGSQIYNEPFKCVAKVIEFMQKGKSENGKD